VTHEWTPALVEASTQRLLIIGVVWGLDLGTSHPTPASISPGETGELVRN
jgi:hypothetical protein